MLRMELIHFVHGSDSRSAGLEVSPALQGWNKPFILWIGIESRAVQDSKLMLRIGSEPSAGTLF